MRAVKIVVPPIELHAGQRAILADPARFKVISAGRRFGKTLLASEWLGFMPGGAIDGKLTAYFAPTYKAAADVWSSLHHHLAPVTARANRTEMRIELVTGGRVDFWTLDNPDAGRGRRYHRLVVDEAAHARYLRDAWERAVAPTLTDFRGEAWFISTPNGLNFFADLHKRGSDTAFPDWASFHMPSAVNPWLPADEIEQWREALPELVFRQEYLAEFVTFGAGMVRPDMLIEAPAPAGLSIAIGVDLAISEREGADWTAIAVMGRDRDSGIVYLIEVERFRGAFAEILRRIEAAAARHRPLMVAVEQTQFQAAVVQELLRTTRLPVRGVRPDRDKVTRFLPLLTRYERHMVRHDPSGVPAWFRDEILAFPQGEHDDGVDAAVYAFAALDRDTAPSAAIGRRVFA